MSGVNKAILIGNLGKDPEVRHFEGGGSVANFTLATTEVYKDKTGNRVENTEWHNIAAWRGLAGVAEKYLKKGSKVYIEGRIRTRSYDDKDGNKRYVTEIIADSMRMLDSRADRGDYNPPSTETVSTPAPKVDEEITDDLPF